MTMELLRLFIAFSVGVFAGRMSNKVLAEEDFDGGDLVLTAVVLIWVLSRVVAMIDRSYQSSPFIDGLMGLIAGYFYKGRKLPWKKEEKNAKKTKSKKVAR